jgi:hypothetical protein
MSQTPLKVCVVCKIGSRITDVTMRQLQALNLPPDHLQSLVAYLNTLGLSPGGAPAPAVASTAAETPIDDEAADDMDDNIPATASFEDSCALAHTLEVGKLCMAYRPPCLAITPTLHPSGKLPPIMFKASTKKGPTFGVRALSFAARALVLIVRHVCIAVAGINCTSAPGLTATL